MLRFAILALALLVPSLPAQSFDITPNAGLTPSFIDPERVFSVTVGTGSMAILHEGGVLVTTLEGLVQSGGTPGSENAGGLGIWVLPAGGNNPGYSTSWPYEISPGVEITITIHYPFPTPNPNQAQRRLYLARFHNMIREAAVEFPPRGGGGSGN